MIIALDIGTSSTRALSFDTSGQCLNMAQREYQQEYPKPGWVEQSADSIIDDTLDALRDVLRENKANKNDVACIGISNQRESIVVWDRDSGTPIYNAIIWQDGRTHEQCKKLHTKEMANYVREKTGLLIDPYFSATKIAWILDNVEGARKKAESGKLVFGTIDSYAIFKLTGNTVHATDATNASRTLLYDIHAHTWDQTLFEFFNIPIIMAPKVYDSAAQFGDTDSQIIGTQLPITGVAGDQQAATFGQCCFDPGEIKATFGTGCFALLNTGKDARLSNDGLLTTIAYQLDGCAHYALEGSIFAAGTVVSWLKNQMGLIEQPADTEIMCRAGDSNQGVYFVPAFNGLGAPHWRPDVSGTISGITLSTTRSEIVRAGIESVVYQTNDLLHAMQKDFPQLTKINVDGGMTKNTWMMQFLADISGLVIDQPKVEESSALGAAFLAGLGHGIYASTEQIKSIKCTHTRFAPNMETHQRAALLAGWNKALTTCLS